MRMRRHHQSLQARIKGFCQPLCFPRIDQDRPGLAMDKAPQLTRCLCAHRSSDRHSAGQTDSWRWTPRTRHRGHLQWFAGSHANGCSTADGPHFRLGTFLARMHVHLATVDSGAVLVHDL